MEMLIDSKKELFVQVASLENKEINEDLKEYARAEWNCIDKLRKTKLPDDRITPDGRLSGETSITNIGLFLPSVIAASELGFLGENESAEELLEECITTIESLERTDKHNFFYTWYDTETKKGLKESKKGDKEKPNKVPIVSSVDTAWLLAGLMVTREAYPQFKERIDKIIKSVDLAYLYDEERGMFWGEYDGKSDKLTGHQYDLLGSETRMLVYIGVSEYGLPDDAYNKLGRGALGDERREDGGEQKIMSYRASALTVLSPEIFVPEGEWSPEGLGVFQDKFVNAMVDRDPSNDGGFMSPHETTDEKGGNSYEGCQINEFSIDKSEGSCNEAPVAAFLGLSRRPREIVSFLNNIKEKIKSVYSEEYGFSNSFNREEGWAIDARLAPDTEMSFLALANYLLDNKVQKLFSPQIEEKIRPLLATEKYGE